MITKWIIYREHRKGCLLTKWSADYSEVRLNETSQSGNNWSLCQTWKGDDVQAGQDLTTV
jgi:hypothetical protein